MSQESVRYNLFLKLRKNTANQNKAFGDVTMTSLFSTSHIHHTVYVLHFTQWMVVSAPPLNVTAAKYIFKLFFPEKKQVSDKSNGKI